MLQCHNSQTQPRKNQTDAAQLTQLIATRAIILTGRSKRTHFHLWPCFFSSSFLPGLTKNGETNIKIYPNIFQRMRSFCQSISKQEPIYQALHWNSTQCQASTVLKAEFAGFMPQNIHVSAPSHNTYLYLHHKYTSICTTGYICVPHCSCNRW